MFFYIKFYEFLFIVFYLCLWSTLVASNTHCCATLPSMDAYQDSYNSENHKSKTASSGQNGHKKKKTHPLLQTGLYISGAGVFGLSTFKIISLLKNRTPTNPEKSKPNNTGTNPDSGNTTLNTSTKDPKPTNTNDSPEPANLTSGTNTTNNQSSVNTTTNIHNQPMCQEILCDRDNFFENVMGCTEKKFKKDENLIRSKFIEMEYPNGIKHYRVVGTDNRQYECGYTEEITLGTLKTAASNLPEYGKIKFSIIYSESPKGKINVDSGFLQANPQNKDAVFQVASNFNALETTSARDAIPNIGQYILDHTQGPCSSISATPGLIYRHYYYFFKERKDKSPMLWRQRPQVKDSNNVDADGSLLQLNLLSELGIKTQNGYTVGSIDVFKQNSDNFKILYHHGTQVTYKINSACNVDQHCFFYDTTQTIDQIFTAAIDCSNGYVRAYA